MEIDYKALLQKVVNTIGEWEGNYWIDLYGYRFTKEELKELEKMRRR